MKYNWVRNSSGRLFQYFGKVTVKAASAYIDETSGTESFISMLTSGGSYPHQNRPHCVINLAIT